MSIQQNHLRYGKMLHIREVLIDILIEDGLAEQVLLSDSVPEDFKRDLRAKIQKDSVINEAYA